MKRLALTVSLVALAGCADMNTPVASSYSEDSVTIRSMSGPKSNDPAVFAEAERLCAMNGRTAHFLGAHPSASMDQTMTYVIGVPVYPNEFLFACRA